jgi:hypothetical protein
MGRHHRIFNESVDLTVEHIDRQELAIILQSVMADARDFEAE